MTTHDESRSTGVEVLDLAPPAATIEHLQIALTAVEDVLVDADWSEPNSYLLLVACQAITSARRTLVETHCESER